MSRELRRVARDWEHPTNEDDSFKPEFARFVTEDMTAYQLYETITEGTPISPVCQTREDMIAWLSHEISHEHAVDYVDHNGAFTDTDPVIIYGERRFCLDDLPYYWGKHTNEYWNGFDCPLFRKEEAVRILDDLVACCGYDYCEIDDIFYVWMSDNYGYNDDEYEEYPPIDNGLYGIGSYSWVWMKV